MKKIIATLAFSVCAANLAFADADLKTQPSNSNEAAATTPAADKNKDATKKDANSTSANPSATTTTEESTAPAVENGKISSTESTDTSN